MQIQGFSTPSRTRGLWALTAAVGLAFAGGCGESVPEGGMVKPAEGQIRAQNAMEEFMKKQGKMPKAKAGKADAAPAAPTDAAPAAPADAEAK